MDITILFQNDDLLIINKPAGIMVHGDGKSTERAVTDWVLLHFPEIAGVGEPILVDGKSIDRPGIVHRLDQETSGALVIAKTQKSFEYLKQQFKDRLVKKEYHAFVWGGFKESKGVIDAPIGRSSGDFRRWQAGRGTRGELRDAVTNWEVVGECSDESGGTFSFMYLFPHTGRTHQLRVHMKYLQRPIVSDHLYASTKPDALGFTRVALHARTITFTGSDGQEIAVSAPYPADFDRALAKYLKS